MLFLKGAEDSIALFCQLVSAWKTYYGAGERIARIKDILLWDETVLVRKIQKRRGLDGTRQRQRPKQVLVNSLRSPPDSERVSQRRQERR